MIFMKIGFYLIRDCCGPKEKEEKEKI